MKISDFLLQHNHHPDSKRSCKSSSLQYTKSKIIKFLGLGLIENYIYSKYWHSVHTKEEMKDKHFYCIFCKEPEYFKEIFSLFLLKRRNVLNPITYVMRIPKWLIHFWHIYFVWINDLHSCPVCFNRDLDTTTVKERKERRYTDMMQPIDPDESDLWWYK